jgi:hypothetical protein
VLCALPPHTTTTSSGHRATHQQAVKAKKNWTGLALKKMAANTFGVMIGANKAAKVNPLSNGGGGGGGSGSGSGGDGGGDASSSADEGLGGEWGDRIIRKSKVLLMPGAKELSKGGPPPGLF